MLNRIRQISFLSLLRAMIVLFGISSVGCTPSSVQKETNQKVNLKFAFYNTENLMDAIDDPKTDDNDFTSNGLYAWNTAIYKQKLKNISQVINKLNADAIGLVEIENEQVLKDLSQLLDKKYNYIHYESHDKRGIDNALLYDASIFELKSTKELTARLPSGAYAGARNILVAELQSGTHSYRVYVNHWPSRKSDNLEKRIAYANTLLNEIKSSSLYSGNTIVMGDFNDNPTDESMKNIANTTPLSNPFKEVNTNKVGTCQFRKYWYVFDQILYTIEPSLLLKSFDINNYDFISQKKQKGGKVPFPNRFVSNNQVDAKGYSDHFPVSIQIKSK